MAAGKEHEAAGMASAPTTRPILLWDAGFWRPVVWANGHTKKDGYWRCIVSVRPVAVDERTKWMEMPPKP